MEGNACLCPGGILSTAELRAFYAEYVAAWNGRDLEYYYSLYSESLVFQDGTEVLHGVAALRERYESELAAFPDLTIECKRLLVDSGTQTLAAENLERGTHSGDLVVGGERLAPTGRKLELRGGLFMALDGDGRIAEMSEYADPGQFLAQLRPEIPSE
ncbi:MAG TPA: ester cyclase [Solirubrobacterales bacterium]|nr:ester cyclase [Solirubrobacterales bacterium]